MSLRHFATLVISLFAVTFAVAPPVHAQQNYVLQLGTPPGQPTMNVPMGVVNLQNGNVHLEFPLRTLIQRNGFKITPKLIYDSKNCYLDPVSTNWACQSGWRLIYSPFQFGDTPYAYTQTSQNTTQCTVGNPSLYYTPNVWSNFTFTDATGSSHLMNVQIDNSYVACTGNPDSNSGWAQDGTGYFMVVTLSSNYGPPSTTVWDKSGNMMGSGKDANGNYLSGTDELGRSYMPGPAPSGGVGAQQWAGSTIQWESIPVHTNFYAPDFNGSVSTVSSITLPDNHTYQFTYDQGTTSGNYGQMIGMTLPTGGQVSFSYTNISPGVYFSGDRRLTSFSQPGGTWNIAYNPNTFYNPGTTPQTTTVTAPADSTGVQNQSVYSFPAPPGPNSTWSAKYYSGTASGTPLRETDIQIDNYTRVTQETTILDNGLSSKIIWNYPANTHDITGNPNVSSRQEYDFSGNLVRETKATYQTSTAYVNAHIIDRPLTVQVYGAGGAASGPLMAETDYGYDTTSLSTTSGTLLNSVVGASGHDDGNYGVTNTTRGNLTSVIQMVSPGNFITTKTNYYNILGDLVQTVDGRLNAIKFDYSDKWAAGTASCVTGSTFAYPTTITYPTTATNTLVTTYNGCDGSTYSTQNQNDINASRAGTVYTYDGLQRVTNITYPDGGSSATNYGGTALPQVITNTIAITSGSSAVSKVSSSTLDGLGRVAQTALTTDPDGPAYTVTAYDALGRVSRTYNATRCPTPTTSCGTSPMGYPENTWGYTSYLYDGLGRTCLIVPPDGTVPSGSGCPATQPSNTIFTTYLGTTTTITDQAGKSRKSVTDALGHLTQVFEDPAGVNYETDYGYDALNNLLCVGQKGTNTGTFGGCTSIPASWRPRTFTYDSLSRLTNATNPESGTVGYSYDADGNVLQKTSPAPNQTSTATVTLSQCYDPLNRATGKAYTAQSCVNGLLPSPLVSYFYDQSSSNGLTITNGIGRRTSMTDQAGSEAWSYDSMGRPLTDQRTTAGITKSIPYTYNLDGSLASIIYRPDSNPFTITYTPGGAGRPISAGNSTYGLAYNVHYAPNGSLCSMHSSWSLEFVYNYTFNNRFQPTAIDAMYVYDVPIPSPCTTPSAPSNRDELNLAYSYTDSNGHNNGNVASIANNLDTHRTELFSYDSLNRLFTANTLTTNQPWYQGDTGALAHCWSEQYTYDPWGNLTVIAPFSSSSYTGCTQESGFNLSNGGINARNQIAVSGYGYDAAGNLTSAPPTGNTYVYDAENHLTSAGGVAYLYDGDGKRVGKAPSSTPTIPNYLYWYGTGSNILEETDGTGAYLYLDEYFDGKLLARSEPDNWVDHFFADALGNVRCVYGDGDPDGGCSDYYPFGGERPISSGGVNVPFKFTSKERDSESGLDNFGARYMTSSFGRFMSPDPLGLLAATPNVPQSWNLYSYVMNNPLNLTDPNGLWCVWEDGTHDPDPKYGGWDEQGCKDQGGHWDSTDAIYGLITNDDGVITAVVTSTGLLPGFGITLTDLDSALSDYDHRNTPTMRSGRDCSLAARLSEATEWKLKSGLALGIPSAVDADVSLNYNLKTGQVTAESQMQAGPEGTGGLLNSGFSAERTLRANPDAVPDSVDTNPQFAVNAGPLKHNTNGETSLDAEKTAKIIGAKVSLLAGGSVSFNLTKFNEISEACKAENQ